MEVPESSLKECLSTWKNTHSVRREGVAKLAFVNCALKGLLLVWALISIGEVASYLFQLVSSLFWRRSRSDPVLSNFLSEVERTSEYSLDSLLCLVDYWDEGWFCLYLSSWKKQIKGFQRRLELIENYLDGDFNWWSSDAGQVEFIVKCQQQVGSIASYLTYSGSSHPNSCKPSLPS